MGTAHYMSPEQALAQEVDHRTDIFSLGVVMYEMAIGRLPFNGATVPSVIERLLHAEPEALTGLNPAVSRRLELVILRCLAKQPEQRYQSARSLWNDLQALRRDAGEVRRWSKARRWVGIGIAGVLAAGLALGSLLWSWLARPEVKAPPPLSMPLPITSYEGEEFFPAFSPDGQQVAFCWRNAVTQETDVYVKAIGAETPTRLTYSEDYEHSPVWSPDGRFIAFIHNERGEGKSGIFVIPAVGGAERKLYPLRHNQTTNGLDWSADGKLLVFTSRDTDAEAYSLRLLELDTLTTRRLTRPPAGSQGDQACVFSPDGQSVAFARGYTGSADLYRIAVSGGEPTRLNQGNDRFWIGDVAWSPDGDSLIYSGAK
jgi:hypothetical protein